MITKESIIMLKLIKKVLQKLSSLRRRYYVISYDGQIIYETTNPYKKNQIIVLFLWKSVYGYDRKNPNLNKYTKDNPNNKSLVKTYEQKKQSTNITSQSAFDVKNISQSNDNVKYSIVNTEFANLTSNQQR